MTNLNWRRCGCSDLTVRDACRQMTVVRNSDFSETGNCLSNKRVVVARGAIVELFVVACEESS